MSNPLPIAQHGDLEEQKAYTVFLQKKFPNYELFWQKFVVGLTNAPKNISFKEDVILTTDFAADSIIKIHERLYIAQLHYSVLRFLLAAHHFAQGANNSYFDFSQVFSALYSALDISSELFARFTNFTNNVIPKWDAFDPKSIDEAIRVRKDWEGKNSYPYDVKSIRDYRNILIHGRILFWGQTFTKILIVPPLGQPQCALDWRVALSNIQSPSFGGYVYSQHVVEQALDIVMKYLDDSWKSYLI